METLLINKDIIYLSMKETDPKNQQDLIIDNHRPFAHDSPLPNGRFDPCECI